ncbi:MAG: GAF domain-containing protein [Chloroflexi bacterium]|nr:GAF domain-containing protein [Chloroflexota bacterium]
MTHDAAGGGDAVRELAEARETIVRQTAEIERLRRRLDDEPLVRDLRDAVRLAATAGAIAAPVTHSRLLEMIVETAADIIGANAASLFLIDREHEDLVFEVALGEKAEEVKKFRVPLGHGLAGLVALTGQPMAISDTSKDDRDASDIAEAVGYVPQNLLCVPLFYGEQTIGVLELLDKQGGTTFTPEDMETLGLFANQAAVAIEQSRNHGRLSALVSGFIQSLGAVPDYQRQSLADRAASFADDVEQEVEYLRGLELARLVQEIVHQGEREFEACRGILQSFAEFLRSRPSTIGETGGMPW